MKRWSCALALVAVLGGGAVASAQSREVRVASESRAAAFRAVEGADVEKVPGGTLLLAAYGVAWVFLLAFVVRLGRLHARTAGEIERLARLVEGQGDASAPKS